VSLRHSWEVRDRAGNRALTRLAESHLLGLIEPDDIASTTLHLASDESRMVTGQVLPVADRRVALAAV
jgi:hypothetical protein